MGEISVLIADDHEIVRQGLASLFRGTAVRICGEAATVEEAVRQARRLEPAVVLLDARFGDTDGLAEIGRIRAAAPGTRVVVLSAFDNPTYVARAAAAGASDYLLKTVSRDELVAAIEAAAGDSPAPKTGRLRRMADQIARKDVPAGAGVSLTPREAQVLRMIALGLANQEIAEVLAISVETVKEHVQNLLRKLALTDRTQAAVWALRHGLG